MSEQIEYRDLPNNPGYRVGSDGSVWSRVGKRKAHMPAGCLLPILTNWRKLKQRKNCRSGRMQVKIYSASLRFKFRHVSQLVLEAFVGPKPNGFECCHNDGDKRNNRLDNLRWGTKESNTADLVEHGTNRGRQNGRHKLNETDVISIRSAYANGATKRGLGRQYGVSMTTITRVVRHIHWSHVA